MVRTGLKRDPGCCPADLMPLGSGVTQGHHLCMRPTCLLRVPVANHHAVLSPDHTPNTWVGLGQPDRVLCISQGFCQPMAIQLGEPCSAHCEGWWCQVLVLTKAERLLSSEGVPGSSATSSGQL